VQFPSPPEYILRLELGYELLHERESKLSGASLIILSSRYISKTRSIRGLVLFFCMIFAFYCSSV
jgi:hypothetical protein